MNRSTTIRALFAGGGTGGHLCPAVAVARALVQQDPCTQVLFLGSDKPLERRILQPSGFPHHAVSTAPFLRGKKLSFAWEQTRGLMQAWRLLGEFRPHVVLGLGGFVSFPGVMAAWLRGIPVALYEPNAVPGRANVFLARLAREAYTHFEATALPGVPLVGTGTPLGDGARAGAGHSRQDARRRLGLPPERRTLLVMGGSQGAKSLNRWVEEGLGQLSPELVQSTSFIHLAGTAEAAARLADVYAQGGASHHVVAFDPQIGWAYRAADLAIVRGGGATLAELAAVGLPGVVVPLPTSAGDHQRRNALAFATGGSGRVLEEAELSPAQLAGALALAHDEITLADYRRHALAAGRPQAAHDVARRLVRLAGRPKTTQPIRQAA